MTFFQGPLCFLYIFQEDFLKKSSGDLFGGLLCRKVYILSLGKAGLPPPIMLLLIVWAYVLEFPFQTPFSEYYLPKTFDKEKWKKNTLAAKVTSA